MENLFEKSITIEEENIQEISNSKSESKLKRKGVGELVREREGLKKTKYWIKNIDENFLWRGEIYWLLIGNL